MDERFVRLRLKRLIWWPLLAVVLVLGLRFVLPRPSFGAIATILAYAFYGAFLGAAVRACQRAAISPFEIVGETPREGRVWLITALLAPLLLTFSAVALVMTMSLADMVVPNWAAQQAEQNNVDFIDRIDAVYRVPLLLAAVAVAPAVEEFAFRGLLLKRWAAARGLWTGILGSAAIFALLHPPTWVGAFVFGVVAGVLYLWSGSLLAPILLHVLNNSLVALALTVGDRPTPQREESPFLDSPAEWIAMGVVLLLLATTIVGVVRPLVRKIHARAAAVEHIPSA
jgi:uncharacterized protein